MEKNKQIVIIGNFRQQFYARGIAEGFEQDGWTVKRLSTDPVNCKEVGILVDAHLFDFYADRGNEYLYDLQVQNRQVDLIDFAPLFPDAQCILMIQDHYTWNIQDVDLPIYYYYTEGPQPEAPVGRVMGLIYAFNGGKDKFKNAHPWQYAQTHWQELVPYGLDPAIIQSMPKPLNDRPIFLGFSGHFELCGKNELYRYRAAVVAHLQLLFPTPEINIQDGYMPFNEYLALLDQSKVAINIPSSEGDFNLRQFEALARGCLLLQAYSPTLEKLGFRDMMNCFFFKDLEELDLKLKFIRDHPECWEGIQKAGLLLVQHHSWIARGKEMSRRICHYDPKEIGDAQAIEAHFDRPFEMEPYMIADAEVKIRESYL